MLEPPLSRRSSPRTEQTAPGDGGPPPSPYQEDSVIHALPCDLCVPCLINSFVMSVRSEDPIMRTSTCTVLAHGLSYHSHPVGPCRRQPSDSIISLTGTFRQHVKTCTDSATGSTAHSTSMEPSLRWPRLWPAHTTGHSGSSWPNFHVIARL